MRDRSLCVGYGITTADYADKNSGFSSKSVSASVSKSTTEEERSKHSPGGRSYATPLTIKKKESLAKTAKVAKQEDNHEKTRKP